jgi:hypothetical protein
MNLSDGKSGFAQAHMVVCVSEQAGMPSPKERDQWGAVTLYRASGNAAAVVGWSFHTPVSVTA